MSYELFMLLQTYFIYFSFLDYKMMNKVRYFESDYQGILQSIYKELKVKNILLLLLYF